MKSKVASSLGISATSYLDRLRSSVSVLMLFLFAGCKTIHTQQGMDKNEPDSSRTAGLVVQMIQTPSDNPEEASAYPPGKSHPHQIRITLANGEEFAHFFEPDGRLRKTEKSKGDSIVEVSRP